MPGTLTRRSAWAVLAACFLLPGVWPAEWLFESVLGLGYPATVAFTVLAAWLIIRVGPKAATRLPDSPWLPVAVGLASVVMVAVMSPSPETLRFGSDRNEALSLATTRLLGGHYPYSEPTSLGVPITPMPGALLLAAPVVAALGNAAYQNAVVLLLILATVWRGTKSAATSAVVTAVLLVSPYVVYQVLVGEDLLANAAYCALGAYWVLRSPSSSPAWRAAAALAFGVALSWRPNFLFAAPVVFAGLARRGGLREAILTGSLTAASFAVVTMPFYLLRPSEFSPLHVMDRTAYTILPHSGAVIGAVSVALCVAGGAVAYRAGEERVIPWTLLAAGAVLGGQVLLIAILNSLEVGALQTGTLGYMIFGVVFWVLGVLPAFSNGPGLRADHPVPSP